MDQQPAIRSKLLTHTVTGVNLNSIMLSDRNHSYNIIVYDAIEMTFLKRKNPTTESRSVAAGSQK
jgi:hypothetical protein